MAVVLALLATHWRATWRDMLQSRGMTQIGHLLLLFVALVFWLPNLNTESEASYQALAKGETTQATRLLLVLFGCALALPFFQSRGGRQIRPDKLFMFPLPTSTLVWLEGLILLVHPFGAVILIASLMSMKPMLAGDWIFLGLLQAGLFLTNGFLIGMILKEWGRALTAKLSGPLGFPLLVLIGLTLVWFLGISSSWLLEQGHRIHPQSWLVIAPGQAIKWFVLPILLVLGALWVLVLRMAFYKSLAEMKKGRVIKARQRWSWHHSNRVRLLKECKYGCFQLEPVMGLIICGSAINYLLTGYNPAPEALFFLSGLTVAVNGFWALNQFGLDAEAVDCFRLFPKAGAEILSKKNQAFALVVILQVMPMALMGLIMVGPAAVVVMMVCCSSQILVLLLIGNYFSIEKPHYKEFFSFDSHITFPTLVSIIGPALGIVVVTIGLFRSAWWAALLGHLGFLCIGLVVYRKQRHIQGAAFEDRAQHLRDSLRV